MRIEMQFTIEGVNYTKAMEVSDDTSEGVVMTVVEDMIQKMRATIHKVVQDKFFEKHLS